MTIDYSAFVHLFSVGDPDEWGPTLSVRPDGVYVRPPPSDVYLTPSERAELSRSMSGAFDIPEVRFPCTLGELEHLADFHGLRGYLDAFELARWIGEKSAASDARSAWPWGNHSTNLLEHMAAAADRFWRNYDRSDQTTAPTNTQVASWLTEQGVSQRVAETMAQILRADGLPTGPRK